MGIRHITRRVRDRQRYQVHCISPQTGYAQNDADDPDAIYQSLIAYYDEAGVMTARIRNIDYTILF